MKREVPMKIGPRCADFQCRLSKDGCTSRPDHNLIRLPRTGIPWNSHISGFHRFLHLSPSRFLCYLLITLVETNETIETIDPKKIQLEVPDMLKTTSQQGFDWRRQSPVSRYRWLSRCPVLLPVVPAMWCPVVTQT